MKLNGNEFRKRIGVGLAWCASLCVVLMMGVFAGSAEAALCPAASALTVCMDFTEPAGVLNLKETVVTPSRDGVALSPIVIPASSVTGGAVQSTAIPTVGCLNDTYTAKAFSNYTTALGVMSSLVVSSTPGVGVVKDRTGEALCFVPPTNFTMH